LPRGQTPSEPAPPPSSPPSIRTQLALATASIESKDYRAALTYADEVLRLSPDDKDATRIRDAARAMLARFDDAISRADRRLAAGDIEGATSALNAARAIDPESPAVGQLLTRIAAQLPAGERARRDAQPPPRVVAASPPVANAPQPPVAGRANPKPADEPAAAAQSLPPAPAVPPPAAAKETPEPRDVPAATPPTARATSQPPAAAPAPAAVAPPPPAVQAPPPRPETSERREPPASPASPESDDAIIRRVVATYARAIETKDLGLFRTVKPNLTPDEQRRIEEGFRAVASQRVSMSVVSIEPRGSDALVRVRRRDTIQAGGRQQTTESLQTMTLTRTVSGWVIREIGR
jgi:hypothetical protein